MSEKFIFRMDKNYSDEGPDKEALEAHDGLECFGDISSTHSWRNMVNVRFADGYEARVFLYELETA